jgi:hypothetical protein
LDLVFDVTKRETTDKFLTIVDEGSHFCINIVANRKLRALTVFAALMAAIAIYGALQFFKCDYGEEFIAKALQEWLKNNTIKTRFIEP